jgi:hypothetical protein
MFFIVSAERSHDFDGVKNSNIHLIMPQLATSNNQQLQQYGGHIRIQ